MWDLRDVAGHLGQENLVAVSREVFDPGSPMVKKVAGNPAMTAVVVMVGLTVMALRLAVIATRPFGQANPAHRVTTLRTRLFSLRLPKMLLLTS